MNPAETKKRILAKINQLPLGEKIRANAILKHYVQLLELWQEQRKAEKCLEKQYLLKDQPILKAQGEIITGSRAPLPEQLKDVSQYLSQDEMKIFKDNIGAAKIEGYWLKALKNDMVVQGEIKPADQPLLAKLQNINVEDEQGTDNFTVNFYFQDNEFIENKVLTKKFVVLNEEAQSSIGCEIKWKEGKNLTLKEVKKKQKNKKTGQQRVVSKTVEAESFFNLFKSYNVEEHKQQLEENYQIFGNIVDQVIPYSLEFYLGVKEDEDLEMDDDDEAIPEASDEEESVQEEKKGKNKKKDDSAAAQKECKQQ